MESCLFCSKRLAGSERQQGASKENRCDLYSLLASVYACACTEAAMHPSIHQMVSATPPTSAFLVASYLALPLVTRMLALAV